MPLSRVTWEEGFPSGAPGGFAADRAMAPKAVHALTHGSVTMFSYTVKAK